MAIYLPTQCPVFWEEFRRRMRGGRAFVVLLAYVLVLIGLLYFVTRVLQLGDDPQGWQQIGKTLWLTFLFGQMVVITLISPGLTAGAISSEREQGTLDLLLLTRMSSFSIVLGKFLGAIGQMLLIILAGLPVIAVVFFFGGVSPGEMAIGYIVILATGIGYSSLGLLASGMSKRASHAVPRAYIFMLVLLAIIPAGIFLFFTLSDGLGSNEQLVLWLTALNPFISTIAYVGEQMSGSHGAATSSIWPSVISLLAMSVLIFAESVMIVRRLRGLSRRFIPRTLKKARAVEKKPKTKIPAVEADEGVRS